MSWPESWSRSSSFSWGFFPRAKANCAVIKWLIVKPPDAMKLRHHANLTKGVFWLWVRQEWRRTFRGIRLIASWSGLWVWYFTQDQKYSTGFPNGHFSRRAIMTH